MMGDGTLRQNLRSKASKCFVVLCLNMFVRLFGVYSIVRIVMYDKIVTWTVNPLTWTKLG